MSGAYYNDNDPKVAAWLRELIKAGAIADGEVDERSILEVEPADLAEFTQCHFFAGIGGWSYALRLAGVPDDRRLWTGSPPCQPFSVAGAGKGRSDERHLAPHFIELVAACRPPVIYGEQVASSSILGRVAKTLRQAAARKFEWVWLDDLQIQLERALYASAANDIPAASVGAPHIRQRTFFGAVDLRSAAGGMADTANDGRHQERALDRWCREGDGAQGRASGYDAGCDSRRLADTTSGNTDAERQQPGGEHRLQPEGIGTRWLAYPHGTGRRQAGCDTASNRESNQGWAGDRDGDGGAHVQSERLDEPAPTCPTNGFWRDADWLLCTDGRWRPVEPIDERMAYGISIALDACLFEVDINVDMRERIAAETLRAMRNSHDPQAIWGQVGVFCGFPTASVLLAVMCQQEGELGPLGDGWTAGSTKGRVTRVLQQMWIDNGKIESPPSGRGFSEQLAREFGSLMPKLSQKSPPHWRALTMLTPGPLANGVPGRAPMIRGYGNAIVPQAAAAFIEVFNHATRSMTQ